MIATNRTQLQTIQSALDNLHIVVNVLWLLGLDRNLAVVLRDQKLCLEGFSSVHSNQENLHHLSHVSVRHEGHIISLHRRLDTLRVGGCSWDLESLHVRLLKRCPALLEGASISAGIRIQREDVAHAHEVISSCRRTHIEAHEVIEASGCRLRRSVEISAEACVWVLRRLLRLRRLCELRFLFLLRLCFVLVAEVRHHELLRGDEVRCGLLVEHRERVELREERRDELLVHIDEALHAALGGVDHAARRIDVVGEEAIIHVDAVEDIGRGVVLRERREEAAQHGLHLRRAAEEELHGGGEELEAHADAALLLEVVDERLDDVGRVGHEVGERADQPETRRAAVRVLRLPQDARDVLHHLLRVLGVLAQHVLHHDRRLGADGVHLHVEELHQRLEAARVRHVQQDAQLADRADRLARRRLRRARHVLLQLAQDLDERLGGRQHRQDLDLQALDEGRLVVPAEELAVLVLERVLAAPQHQLHVRQHAVRHLGDVARHQRQQRLLQPRHHLLEHLRHVLRERQVHLRRRQDHRRVVVAQERLQQVHDAEQLRLVLRLVLRHQVQHRAHAPLIEVLQPVQEVVDQGLRLRKIARDLLQRQQRVRHHQGISIQHQVLKSCHQVAVTHTILLDVEQLQYTHNGIAAYIRTRVHQPTLQTRNHILHDRLQTERAQGT